ncbi:MAG: DinB family protein [Paenisporosarcina sp.]|nr:DinB family protein [Paenisporosarcina sp.]
MDIRPVSGDYPVYYANYINLVDEGPLTGILFKQLEETTALISNVSKKQGDYRYAIGKWTLKEVIGHITDTERIMAYRLLRFARGDQTALAGYEDERYVKEAEFHSRSLKNLLEEFSAVRHSTISLIKNLPEDSSAKKGIANNGEISVAALAYIIAGHELHHRKMIEEKYLI